MTRRRWIPLLAIGLLLGVVAGVVYQVRAGLQPIAASGEERLFQVEKGAGLSQVAESLEEAGLIRSARILVLVARYQKKGDTLYAGHYVLSPSMAPLEMLQKIEAGDVATVRVTIPEGFTVKQIAAALAEKGLADEARFLALCAQPTASVATGLRPAMSRSRWTILPWLWSPSIASTASMTLICGRTIRLRATTAGNRPTRWNSILS